MLGRRAGHPCRFSCPSGRGRSQRNHVEKSLLAGRVRESARIRACRSSGNRTDEGVRPCLAEVACVGTIVFPVRIVWRLLPRRQRMNRIVRGRDGSMPLPESGRFACRKADLSRSRIDSLPDESFPVGTSRTVPDIYPNPMRMRNCLRGILGIPRNERHKASPSLSDCRMARGAMAFVRGTIRQGTVSDAKKRRRADSRLCARSAPLGSEIRRICALARKIGRSGCAGFDIIVYLCSVICRKPSPHWGAGRPELT